MNGSAKDGWLAALEGCEVERFVEPPSAEDLAREVSRARAEGRSVLPIGNGSRLAAGSALARVDVALATTKIGRILQYEPADLTVTVEAGCALAALGDALRERGQFLPLQAARGRGTVGGLVATADEGALTLGYGRVRDRLIGVKAALADGTIVKGGGRVVKNVAGYPLHRLLSGSFGTLGVVVEASFKIQPLPEACGTRVFAFSSESDAFEAARLALASGTEPVFVDVLGRGDLRRLAVGYDGGRARVEAHLAGIADHVAQAGPEGSLVLSPQEDEDLRRALDDPERIDHALGVCAREDDGDRSSSPNRVRCIVRIAALPSRLEATLARGRAAVATAAAAGAASGALVLDAQPGLGSARALLAADQEMALSRTLGAYLAAVRESGHAIILSAPRAVRAKVDPWGPPPPDFFLMKRIKDALDPDGVFVTGRFVGGL